MRKFLVKPIERISYNGKYYNEGDIINIEKRHLTERLKKRLIPIPVKKEEK